MSDQESNMTWINLLHPGQASNGQKNTSFTQDKPEIKDMARRNLLHPRQATMTRKNFLRSG
jgi:hypothetical protein